jgi:hypothetical protein
MACSRVRSLSARNGHRPAFISQAAFQHFHEPGAWYAGSRCEHVTLWQSLAAWAPRTCAAVGCAIGTGYEKKHRLDVTGNRLNHNTNEAPPQTNKHVVCVTPSFPAASLCVIGFVFFRATIWSREAIVISNCPSCAFPA